MPTLKSLCFLLALVLFLPACGQEEGAESGTTRIDALVIRSKEFDLYDKAIEGFKHVFQGSEKILTMQTPDDDQKLLAEIRDINPRVILTAGLRAARWVRENAPDVPTVFCMAMHPEDNRLKTKSMTGVHLEPAPGDQLRAFARALPQVVKIGLLYDPERTGLQVEAIKKAAKNLGLEILARPVKTREEVPAALKEVVAEAQALWLLRDATVLTREFFNHTLVLQLSMRMPLIAYSEQFVRKGAFFSYSASYRKQGEKAGDIANRILEGESPADIPLKHPDGALAVNLEVGQKMGIVAPIFRDHLPPGNIYRMEYRHPK